jgi:hypothetical protein
MIPTPRPNEGKQRIAYIAFPGMGKTTYAKSHTGVIDLDYGMFRDSWFKTFYQHHPKMGAINRMFTHLCVKYAKQGWIILTNDPALAPLLKQSGFNVIIEVPSDVEELVERVALRDGEKDAFVQALRRNGPEWVSSWIQTATKYQLPLVKGKYFKEVNMPYEEENK